MRTLKHSRVLRGGEQGGGLSPDKGGVRLSTAGGLQLNFSIPSKGGGKTAVRVDLATVRKLKAGSGKDMIVYGGSSFVSALLKERLVDEFHLFVNPIALGKGEAIFSELDGWQALRLRKSIAYDCGLVLLNYELK